MPGSSVRQRQGLTPVQLVVLVVLVAVIGVVEFVGVAAQHDAVGVEVGVEAAVDVAVDEVANVVVVVARDRPS